MTAAELDKLVALADKQDCPFCGAVAGAPCVVMRAPGEPTEQRAGQPHASRIARAERRRL